MLRSFLLCAAFAASSCATLAQAAAFGAPMPDGEALAISAAAADASLADGTARKFTGRITDVCQAKGCWIVLEHDGRSARVMMKDHAFLLPKDARGQAVVYGTLEQRELDEKAIAHFEAESTGPVAAKELRIQATSVELVEG